MRSYRLLAISSRQPLEERNYDVNLWYEFMELTKLIKLLLALGCNLL